jgi:hypothetical protein
MIDENKIFVIYVGIQGIRSEDIEDFINKVTQRISPSTIKGEYIVIPTHSLNTRIECINPKYITNSKLIKEHSNMIKKLQEELQNQLEQLINKNNE